MPSTFSEVFSDSKKKQGISREFLLDMFGTQESPMVPYSLKVIDASRLSYLDLPSGHLKSLTSEQGLKVFKICTKSNAAQASSEHILHCLNFNLDELFLKPLLFLNFWKYKGLMEFV
ncbi:hypothetical protein TNCV_1310381 [Trichonephila clavipes]|nr:hypothetical protein TNCV_1310381 [Trichonephila clavipes]